LPIAGGEGLVKHAISKGSTAGLPLALDEAPEAIVKQTLALAVATLVGCGSGSGTSFSGPGSVGAGTSNSGGGYDSGLVGDDAATPPYEAGAYEAGAYDAGRGGDDSDGGSSDAGDEPSPLSFTCTPVANGVGAVSVNGAAPRQYYVDLPADTSQPMALLFSWHGYMQAPLDFKNSMGFDPNGGAMPIVVVTPTDTGLFLPQGLDWYILGSNGNIDFPYFEGMLHCLESEFSIDDTRIYSFGFSAGAVFTDLLASQWPHLFAATISESGAWFSDTPEVACIDGVGLVVPWDWPPLASADKGNVLMTHGGPTDYATIISIECADTAALPFLLKNDRTVVDCAHTAGHAIDPDVSNQMIYEYLLAHQLGKPSPFQGVAAGAPPFPNFPSSCTVNLP
jgi:predicted esterase